MATRRGIVIALMLALVLSACNLAGAPSEQQIEQTATAAATQPPTRTPQNGVPTTVPVNPPTSLPTFQFPTAIVSFPTNPPVVIPTSIPPATFPTNTPLPVSIVILSPVPGNVVAGNVQILGSAIHPQFLQYQVEFGPDPNPGNLWFPATSAVTTPIINGLLGIWNTNAVQDSRYQLRLRVYLRDGTLLTTVVNNIVVQNRVNTPVPSATQSIPRPIAAFTQDKASGDVPLTVQFTNQSSGTINSVAWNFGDGNSSDQVNPSHTFGAPGLYTVTLTVSGPGGSSNVSRQINATSPTAPVAGFTQDRTGGVAPTTIQFTDQSSGSITSYQWNFSDGSTSAERNPSHTFSTPGTYNVFLTVTGPGGSSSVTRQFTISSPVPPTATFTNTSLPPTLTFTPTNTDTPVPPTFTFTPSDTPTGTITVEPPTATFTPTDTSEPPTLTFTPTFTDTASPEPPTATSTLPPAPAASFTASIAPGDPMTVQFTNQSTGESLSYVWDFGDGTDPASEPNPSHTYFSEGTYTITLLVTDIVGQTATFAGRITVTAPVQADFLAQPAGLTVQFTDRSSGQIAQYTWDFGDGSTSNEQNPQHAYTASGTFTVTLTVTGLNGTSNSKTLPVVVIPPLQANFSAQVADLSVQFTDRSSGQVAQYLWDFGDGQTSSEQNPQHTYQAAGTYNVVLTVTGNDLQINSQTQQVSVTAPVKASFAAQANALNVQFTDQSSGAIALYSWDFGDGSGANQQNPQHTYAADGTYTVTLSVTGTNGTTDSQSQQIAVALPVQANFSAQVSGLTVQFTNMSAGQITQYAWDFGDGATSNEQNPQHTYQVAGNFNVSLTVSDAEGQSNQQLQQVSVVEPVQANFSAQANGLTVQFTDQSTGSVAQFNWDFGDGQTSNEQNPQHAYLSPGIFNATLTVVGLDGTSNSQTQQVAVSAPVQANFDAQANGLTVQFTDQSVGNIAQFSWDFGDGQTSNEQNPQHAYQQGGTYNVTLTVADTGGTANSTTQQVEVSTPLAASFTAQATDLTVQFADQSTGSITTFAWDFGDGQTSNEQNPQHAYQQGGTYNVVLTITDANGRSDSQTQQVTVTQPQQPQQPSIVDSTPILPDFNALRDALRNIYAMGVNSAGSQASIFSVAGDSVFTLPGVLTPFAPGGQYNVGSQPELQAGIDWFNSTQPSFSRTSLAVNPNFSAADLLDMSKADPSCNGEAPILCEVHTAHPILMFIAIGSTDARNGTDINVFQSALGMIVSTVSNNGTIPVLVTIPDDGSNPNLAAINEAIINVARSNNLPLLNAARAINELPSFNLDAGGIGPGGLGDATSQYGINRLNQILLQVLTDARNIIFPDA